MHDGRVAPTFTHATQSNIICGDNTTAGAPGVYCHYYFNDCRALTAVPDVYFWLKSILRIDTQCVYVCKWFRLKFKPRFPESFKFGPGGSNRPPPPPRGRFVAGFGTDAKTKDSQSLLRCKVAAIFVVVWRGDGWWTWMRLGGIKPKCRVLAWADTFGGNG